MDKPRKTPDCPPKSPHTTFEKKHREGKIFSSRIPLKNIAIYGYFPRNSEKPRKENKLTKINESLMDINVEKTPMSINVKKYSRALM